MARVAVVTGSETGKQKNVELLECTTMYQQQTLKLTLGLDQHLAGRRVDAIARLGTQRRHAGLEAIGVLVFRIVHRKLLAVEEEPVLGERLRRRHLP